MRQGAPTPRRGGQQAAGGLLLAAGMAGLSWLLHGWPVPVDAHLLEEGQAQVLEDPALGQGTGWLLAAPEAGAGGGRGAEGWLEGALEGQRVPQGAGGALAGPGAAGAVTQLLHNAIRQSRGGGHGADVGDAQRHGLIHGAAAAVVKVAALAVAGSPGSVAGLPRGPGAQRDPLVPDGLLLLLCRQLEVGLGLQLQGFPWGVRLLLGIGQCPKAALLHPCVSFHHETPVRAAADPLQGHVLPDMALIHGVPGASPGDAETQAGAGLLTPQQRPVQALVGGRLQLRLHGTVWAIRATRIAVRKKRAAAAPQSQLWARLAAPHARRVCAGHLAAGMVTLHHCCRLDRPAPVLSDPFFSQNSLEGAPQGSPAPWHTLTPAPCS